VYDSKPPPPDAVPVSFGDVTFAAPATPKPGPTVPTTTPKPTTTTTDKYDFLRPKRPEAGDFGLDNFVFDFGPNGGPGRGGAVVPGKGKLFERDGFPSFTNTLNNELKGLFGDGQK
jgi:hypothetical protein